MLFYFEGKTKENYDVGAKPQKLHLKLERWIEKRKFKPATKQQNLALSHILRNLTTRKNQAPDLKLSIIGKPPWQGNLHCWSPRDICPSLGRNPLKEETSMAKLQSWNLEQHLKICKYKHDPEIIMWVLYTIL